METEHGLGRTRWTNLPFKKMLSRSSARVLRPFILPRAAMGASQPLVAPFHSSGTDEKASTPADIARVDDLLNKSKTDMENKVDFVVTKVDDLCNWARKGSMWPMGPMGPIGHMGPMGPMAPMGPMGSTRFSLWYLNLFLIYCCNFGVKTKQF